MFGYDRRMSSAKRRGQWRERERESAEVREWVELILLGDVYEWGETDEELTEFLLRMRQLADYEVALDEEQWDALAWRVAHVAAQIAWEASWPLHERLELVDNVARFVRLPGMSESALKSGVHMAWDIIVSPGLETSMTFRDEPGGDPAHVALGERSPMVMNFNGKSVTFSVADHPGDHEIANRIFDHLMDQLAQPNRWLQFSALHGLNHLRDPRTSRLIERVRASLADDEVRSYADGAAEFRLV